MPFSLRLDPKTIAKLRRLAAESGRSKSAVVREAVARYGVDTDQALHAQSAFLRLQPFVGVIRTGGAQYSRETHAKYRAALSRKHSGRRSR